MRTKKAAPKRQTMTIPEAARKLGVGRNAGYRAARSGQIPTIRIGKRLLVPAAAFDRLLEGKAE
jgi:excisionase family DNA binding protein